MTTQPNQIDTTTTAGKIAVMSASEGGEKTQRMLRSGIIPQWEDNLEEDLNVWNWFTFDYRIKPELPKPRDWWVNRYPAWLGSFCETRDEADSYENPSRLECIHVREVLP